MVAGGRELIDTLWNVNTNLFQCEVLSCSELIDTLWNVNKDDIDKIRKAVNRINRYIMECKYKYDFYKTNKDKRINRYIMECKSAFLMDSESRRNELIDTLWNVNIKLSQRDLLRKRN